MYKATHAYVWRIFLTMRLMDTVLCTLCCPSSENRGLINVVADAQYTIPFRLVVLPAFLPLQYF